MNWKTFLAIGILSPLLMAVEDCSQRPAWTAKFWAGDSQSGTVIRAQANESVSCRQVEFDNFVCLTYDDLRKLETEVLSRCQSWK